MVHSDLVVREAKCLDPSIDKETASESRESLKRNLQIVEAPTEKRQKIDNSACSTNLVSLGSIP
jgi:hypothetical protein